MTTMELVDRLIIAQRSVPVAGGQGGVVDVEDDRRPPHIEVAP
jgi:hypothetical protein